MNNDCEPIGACCGPVGLCYESTKIDCSSRGHIYQGDNTTCSPNNPCTTTTPSPTKE